MNYTGVSLNLVIQSVRSRLSFGYLNIAKIGTRNLRNYNSSYLNNVNYGTRSRLAIGYTINNYKYGNICITNNIGYSIKNTFGSRSIVNDSCINLSNPVESIRSIKNYTSDSFIKISQLIKNITNKSGYTTNSYKYCNRNIINNYSTDSNFINTIISTRKIVNNTGYTVGILNFNNISIDDIKLTVTPAKTFAGSTITVLATNKNILGKYHLLINGIELIHYQISNIDISSISFNIDNSKLIVGDNICKLEYEYDNRIGTYVQFKIIKESGDRTLTTENIYWYSGDYKTTGNLEIVGADIDVYKRSVEANGLISTNESGWFECSEDVTNELGISNIIPNCSTTGVLFLVSFDNKTTYLSFKNSTWSTVNITNIETVGMTKAELTAITENQWKLVFKRTKFTIIASLDYTRVNSEIAISSFNVRVGYHEWFNYTLPTDDEYIYSRIIFGGAYGGVLIANIYDRNNINIFSISYPGSSGASYYFNDSIKLLPYNYTVGSEVGVDPPGRGSGVFYGKRRNIKLNSIAITYSPNYAPALSNISLDSTTTHLNAVLTMHIKDNEGDISYYKIDVNGTQLLPYTTQNLSEYNITVQIPSSITNVGTNAINITTTDLLRISDVQTIYLTKTDTAPTILVSLFNYGILNTIISDEENDTISYRLTLNNNVKIDWANYVLGPINVNYSCNINDIIIGKQNTLLIEAKDSLGVISSSEIDFVGSYFGLLFKDSSNNVYSNNLGKTIKKLDFGTIICGMPTQTKDIVISNNTVNDLQNLEINAEINDNYNIQLSDSNNPFTASDKINLSQLNSGKDKIIYTRLIAGSKSNVTELTDINVKADSKNNN